MSLLKCISNRSPAPAASRLLVALIGLLVGVPLVAQVFMPARRVVPSLPSSGSTPPIDLLTNVPWSAYSVSRKLWSGWTGGAYVVQRDLDAASNIIGFTASGAVDTNALMAFLGTTNGYTQAIYDQSGNGRHLDVFANITNTLLVASNGIVVVDEHGRPAGWHRDTTTFAHISGPSAGASSNTSFVVTSPLSLSGVDPDALVNAGGASQCAINITSSSFFSVLNDPAGTPVTGTPVNFGRQYLATGLFRTSNVEVLQVNFNGSDTYSGEAGELTSASLSIGRNAAATSTEQAFNELFWYSTQADTNTWSILSQNMVDYYEIDQGPPNPPDNPVILWYKFTEGSGGTAADSSGNGYTGNITGATWITGKSGIGFALEFDGVNDFVESAGSVTYGASIVTVCAWVWIVSSPSVKVVYSSRAATFPFFGNINATTIQQGEIYDSDAFANGRVEFSSTGATGAWFHWAIVYDNSSNAGDIKIYHNGALQGTTLSLNTKTTSGTITATPFFLAQGGAGALFANVKLDDVRIYSGELTESEVVMVMLDPQ